MGEPFLAAAIAHQGKTLDMKSAGLCKVCFSEDTRETLTVDNYQIYRCGKCSHLGVIGSVDQSILEAAYDQNYYQGLSATSGQLNTKGYKDYLGNAGKKTKGFTQTMRKIERLLPTPGKLLDYGCAVGLFVKVAKDAGWEAKGLERSPWAVRYGREVLGLDIELGDGRLNRFEAESFDVVTLWDVLEHLEDPRGILKQIKQWLRPGGLIFLNTVDSSSLGARLAGRRWRHMTPPHHLQYFTRRSLMLLLRLSGFKVVELISKGVVLSGTQGDRPLTKTFQLLDDLMTHWRVRRIATAFHLMDEIEVVAMSSRTELEPYQAI